MKNHGRPHRSRRLIALLSVLLLATAACGDEPGGGKPSGAQADGQNCDEVRLVLHQPVIAPTDAGPSRDEGLAAIRRFAPAADGQAAADLRELADLLERLEDDDGSLDGGDTERLRSLLANVSAWALDACPPTEPTWGCVSQSQFVAVGDRIGGDDSSAGGPTSDTPEAAVGEGADKYEQVAVERTSERVLFAYLDESGLTRRTDEALRSNDGWTLGATRSCN